MTIEETIRAAVREAVLPLEAKLARIEQAIAGGEVGLDDYLTVEQAAKIAGVHEATIRRWLRDGDLHRYSAGRSVRIQRDDLKRFLATGPARGEAPDPEEAALALLKRHA